MFVKTIPGNKIRWPFKILLLLILIPLALLALSAFNNTYDLLAYGKNARGIVVESYVTGGYRSQERDTTVNIVVAGSLTGRGFTQRDSLIPTYYYAGEDVPVVFHDKGQEINGTIGTKTSLMLKIGAGIGFVIFVTVALGLGLKKKIITTGTTYLK